MDTNAWENFINGLNDKAKSLGPDSFTGQILSGMATNYEMDRQSELTRQELDRVRNEKDAEKRRVQEKQIRSLRRNYGLAGLLGQGSPANNDNSEKLGG